MKAEGVGLDCMRKMDKSAPGPLAIPEVPEEDDASDGTFLQLSLHRPPFVHQHRRKCPELCKTFSTATWCGRRNLIASATETCAKDPGSKDEQAFWIPVHLVDPERPTEHAIFNVTADSSYDTIDFLEWSPAACPRALLVANSHGRVTIWSQPSQGPINLARTFNCWTTEHAWRQDRAVVTKWVAGVPAFRWPGLPSANSKPTFEEKFLGNQTSMSAQWPSFLCVCTVLSSGSVQLHWRAWPESSAKSPPKWFSTSKGILGAGPSGIFAADIIISETGTLLVAGVPIGNPSTVVIWEITPSSLNNSALQQVNLKFGALSSVTSSTPSWSVISPLAALMLGWQEASRTGLSSSSSEVENGGPLLQSSPISNLSAYVNPEAAAPLSSGSLSLTTWGSGVAAVAFDPAKSGSVLFVIVVEGHSISLHHSDGGPSVTGWRFQRWESSRQQVAIHSVFECGSSSLGAMPHPMATTWNAVVNKSIPVSSHLSTSSAAANLGLLKAFGSKHEGQDHTPIMKCMAKIVFSAHGGEVAFLLVGGDIHLFSVSDFISIKTLSFPVVLSVVTPAFSASGCCLSVAWHDREKDITSLEIMRVEPPSNSGGQLPLNAGTSERQIADRFWWSMVTELDWWDAVAFARSASEENLVSIAGVASLLDADFHSLPTITHRQHYGPILDRIKCQMLEGQDAADLRALVLDMQARLLLEMLGKGIETAIINPATLISEPWNASSEQLTGIGGDAMVVDQSLVLNVHSYVDAVLDLASHFLTRLRRYASFCRTLATHAVPSSASAAPNNRTPAGNPVAGAPPSSSASSAQATSTTATSNGGAAQVTAWVQGAIAKINNNTDGAAASLPALNGPSPPLQFSVGTSTFPGIPAVRLMGDCYFLHRLCQLLWFCLVFRKRQLPRFFGKATEASSVVVKSAQIHGKNEEVATSVPSRASSVMTVKGEEGGKVVPTQLKGTDEINSTRSARLGSGNAGQGYTADEVKYLFLVLLDLCKRTSSLPHPPPKHQPGTNGPSFRLHYVDGHYSVAPEVVEASLGPHMQNLPRPKGADAAGLLMRELELHPPAEEWNKRNISGGPWSGPLEYMEENSVDGYQSVKELWPRKRRFAERDAACGLKTAAGLGSFMGFMGSRRDVITASWKISRHGVWHKCMRCGRQTASLAAAGSKMKSAQDPRQAWWTGRWAFTCPMCGGHWVRVV